MIRISYSKEFEDDMRLKSSSCSLDDLWVIAKYKYKYNVSRDNLQKYLSRRKIRYVGYNPKKANQSKQLPIGTEYIKDDGMTLIKVKPDKWQYKQRYIYEKYHNVKLKSTDYVIFLDGNRNNFDIDNLKCVDCRKASMYANLRLGSTDKEITEAALLYADSAIMIKELEGVKPRSHKRRNKNEVTSN